MTLHTNIHTTIRQKSQTSHHPHHQNRKTDGQFDNTNSECCIKNYPTLHTQRYPHRTQLTTTQSTINYEQYDYQQEP